MAYGGRRSATEQRRRCRCPDTMEINALHSEEFWLHDGVAHFCQTINTRGDSKAGCSLVPREFITLSLDDGAGLMLRRVKMTWWSGRAYLPPLHSGRTWFGMISYSGLRHNSRLGVVPATPTMCLQHFDHGALFLLVTGIRASPACYCIMEKRIPAET